MRLSISTTVVISLREQPVTELAGKPARCLVHDVLFEVLESRVAELIAARLSPIKSAKDLATLTKRTEKVLGRKITSAVAADARGG